MSNMRAAGVEAPMIPVAGRHVSGSRPPEQQPTRVAKLKDIGSATGNCTVSAQGVRNLHEFAENAR